MIIALDLAWMSDRNDSGGAYHYALRLTQALVEYSSESIVAIVDPDLSDVFQSLKQYGNFKLIKLTHPNYFISIINQENVDVIHRPLQEFDRVTLSVPMINSLHDLQHFYYPGFFGDKELSYREIYYRGAAEFSERVIVSYQHVKEDVVKYYGIAPDKIDVCPVGMVVPEPLDNRMYSAVKHKYKLPERYLFYPAATWRHKNHIRLLEALKLVHEQYGIDIDLICTGRQVPDYFSHIKQAVTDLGLGRSARFLGYVPNVDMQHLLTHATLVVIPTLYEAGSYPLLEAMAYGVPVICSNVTSLPESIGDSRFVFDPTDVGQMAALIVELLNSPKLTEENMRNSFARAQEGGWAFAVQAFLASYKSAIESFKNKKSRVYTNKCIAYYEEELAKRQNRNFSFFYRTGFVMVMHLTIRKLKSNVKKIYKFFRFN